MENFTYLKVKNRADYKYLSEIFGNGFYIAYFNGNGKLHPEKEGYSLKFSNELPDGCGVIMCKNNIPIRNPKWTERTIYLYLASKIIDRREDEGRLSPALNKIFSE